MFEGQYNDAYKEVELEYSIKLNTVVPNNRISKVDEQAIDKWLKQNIEILQSSLQVHYGNCMQSIIIVKMKNRELKYHNRKRKKLSFVLLAYENAFEFLFAFLEEKIIKNY